MEVIFADFKALANREQRAFGESRSHRLVMAEMERELRRRSEARGPTPEGEPCAAATSPPGQLRNRVGARARGRHAAGCRRGEP